jgi:hypothetical protein
MHTGAFFKGVYNRTGDPAHNPDLPWATSASARR